MVDMSEQSGGPKLVEITKVQKMQELSRILGNSDSRSSLQHQPMGNTTGTLEQSIDSIKNRDLIA